MRRTTGSSLVESLVALSIFAIGSAATGAWLARSAAIDVRATRSAVATTLGVSLEARMRANEGGVSGGSYSVSATGSTSCREGCDAAALAAADIAWFRRAVAYSLGVDVAPDVACTDTACVIVVREGARPVIHWTFRR